MEKERRIFDYFSAKDVEEEGMRERIKRRFHDNPHNMSKEELRDIFVDDEVTKAVYAVKAMIVSLARLSLIVPAGRLIQKGFKNFRKSPPETAK